MLFIIMFFVIILQDGSTPLLIACKENQTEIAFKLISSGANINTYARVSDFISHS